MTITNELIDSLLADYKKPEDLIGENGLLKQLTKRLVERALEAEMAQHLGHAKNESVTSIPVGTLETAKARRRSRANLANCRSKFPAIVMPVSSRKSSPSTKPAGLVLTRRFCPCTPEA